MRDEFLEIPAVDTSDLEEGDFVDNCFYCGKLMNLGPFAVRSLKDNENLKAVCADCYHRTKS